MEFKAYIHNDRTRPRLVIPLTDTLFLAWIAPEDGTLDVLFGIKWTLRHISELSIKDKDRKDLTIEELCESSMNMREATQLEILLYTNYSTGQVEDLITDHMTTIPDLDGSNK